MLYIIRHGETELNSKHVLQGRSDHELDSKGFDQSRKAAEWLKKEGISFPEDIREKTYPQDVDGTYPMANRDFHTMYVGEIVDAYIIK